MLIERVGNVTLTEVVGSPYYYARYRRKGKQVTRSLRTACIETARVEAQKLSETLTATALAAKADFTFRRFANEMIERDVRKVQRGERAPTLVTDQRRILKVYCDATLGSLDVRKIHHHTLQEFVDELTDLDLSSATIKIILVLVNKTMTAAVMAGVISHVPIIPKVSTREGVRGWFSLKEYQRLLIECKKHEDAGTKVRTQVITNELRRFATFSVNTFIRPSDAKQLRHRHVEVVRTKETQYLRITTDFSKTVLSPIISMPNAVPIYEKLLKDSRAAGYGKADDYVFMPAYKNRKFVIRTFGNQLRTVTQSAGLYMSPSGQTRTLYSLRHSSIMFRLLKGKDMCLMTLARSARTSVEMLDRFYCKHLTAEMNVDVLQSMK
jgi:hypothetical protein